MYLYDYRAKKIKLKHPKFLTDGTNVFSHPIPRRLVVVVIIVLFGDVPHTSAKSKLFLYR